MYKTIELEDRETHTFCGSNKTEVYNALNPEMMKEFPTL